jgi:hypothetical protein
MASVELPALRIDAVAAIVAASRPILANRDGSGSIATST